MRDRKNQSSRNYATSKTYALEIARGTRVLISFFSEGQHCVRASISIISMNKLKRETGESEASVVRILLV